MQRRFAVGGESLFDLSKKLLDLSFFEPFEKFNVGLHEMAKDFFISQKKVIRRNSVDRLINDGASLSQKENMNRKLWWREESCTLRIDPP